MVWVEIHPYRLPHAYKLLNSSIIVQPDDLAAPYAAQPPALREALNAVHLNRSTGQDKFAHQREYRIIGSQPVEWHLKSDENNPGRKTEEYGHAELDLNGPPGLINIIIESICKRYLPGETIVRRRIEI